MKTTNKHLARAFQYAETAKTENPVAKEIRQHKTTRSTPRDKLEARPFYSASDIDGLLLPTGRYVDFDRLLGAGSWSAAYEGEGKAYIIEAKSTRPDPSKQILEKVREDAIKDRASWVRYLPKIEYIGSFEEGSMRRHVWVEPLYERVTSRRLGDLTEVLEDEADGGRYAGLDVGVDYLERYSRSRRRPAIPEGIVKAFRAIAEKAKKMLSGLNADVWFDLPRRNFAVDPKTGSLILLDPLAVVMPLQTTTGGGTRKTP